MEVGDEFPGFRLTDQNGAEVDSAELAGVAHVVYFYPRDNTPGCTAEALDFNASLAEFEAVGVRVLGVSADSVKSHANFADRHGLGFTLLSDPDKVLLNAVGAWGTKRMYGREYEGVFRTTFLIGRDGRVARAWRKVRVKGHVAEVLEAARALG
ncbi:MAG: peroxiredoxin [Thermoplasmatales archaeon]|nr:peroxiredoxin [Thermoplasmatales archaeon]